MGMPSWNYLWPKLCWLKPAATSAICGSDSRSKVVFVSATLLPRSNEGMPGGNRCLGSTIQARGGAVPPPPWRLFKANMVKFSGLEGSSASPGRSAYSLASYWPLTWQVPVLYVPVDNATQLELENLSMVDVIPFEANGGLVQRTLGYCC